MMQTASETSATVAHEKHDADAAQASQHAVVTAAKQEWAYVPHA